MYEVLQMTVIINKVISMVFTKQIITHTYTYVYILLCGWYGWELRKTDNARQMQACWRGLRPEVDGVMIIVCLNFLVIGTN